MSNYSLHNNIAESRFEFNLGDGSFALIDYKIATGVYLLLHTEVPESHGGKGIAVQLAEATFAWLRTEGKKAKLYCPFLVKYVGKHAEWSDILYSGPELQP